MEFIEAWQSTGWTFGKIMIIFWAVLLTLVGIMYLLTDKEAKADLVGNTVGNIINQGLFAQGGDWIYFSNYRGGNTLCKKRLLGSAEIIISHDVQARYINVLDDWIFYSALPREKQIERDSLLDHNRYLYKVKTDGSKHAQLNSHNTLNVQVIGGWIYYTSYNREAEKFHLYRMRVDGQKQTLIKDDVGMNACIVDGWAYYSIEDGIYRIKTDGRGNIRICDDRASYITRVGKWIYYRNLSGEKGCLYKIKASGTERARLNQDDSLNIMAADDWVYYINIDDSSNIYRVKTDGSDRSRINEAPTSVFNILEDKVFYVAENDVPYWIPADPARTASPKMM
jgi:eukaryotic-like serine/threonine-protein kinase